jgi:hypothetical protein
MRRIYINSLLSGEADPPVGKPSARKNERNVFAQYVIKDG